MFYDKYQIKIDTSTISKILKNSSSILVQGKPKRNEREKYRQRKAKHPLLENALYEWMLRLETQMVVTGDMIKEKASRFWKLMYPEMEEPQWSSGWLSGFKKRHGIKERLQHGEARSVDLDLVQASLPAIHEKTAQYPDPELQSVFINIVLIMKLI
jgi:Tc5 transposase DNA-binding domain